jgi:quercetin dioxygenase-like cupin family protein
MYEVILKRFENPDEVRTFEKGKFELVRIGNMTIGRASYAPGWKWSEHVGKVSGAKSCMVEHTGMVVSGCATAAMDDGRVIEMKAGDLFYIAPGHDSWVVGDEPYVSLHFSGAVDYASKKG